jgi:spore coat polysaccharide biosynthesis protein SpsF (cytidylyltransferase family)
MSKYEVISMNLSDHSRYWSVEKAKSKVQACKQHLKNELEDEEDLNWVNNLSDNLKDLQRELTNRSLIINVIKV